MSQKTDNLIKLALVFFVSLLSFSIGTYVGKKYSDNQHKLALLEPKKQADEAVAANPEFETEKEPVENTISESTPEASVGQINTDKPSALTDSEVAQLAEEFATEDETPTELPEGTELVENLKPDEKIIASVTEKAPPPKTLTPKAVAPTATVVVKKEAPVAPTIAATTMAKTKATSAVTTEDIVQPTPRDIAEEREPASLPPVAAMVKPEITPVLYTVQIGSFPTENEATDMTKSLQNKGYKTSYVPAKVNGQTWYRVNVGLFGTIREAQDYKKEFLGKTQLSSAIIQRVQN